MTVSSCQTQSLTSSSPSLNEDMTLFSLFKKRLSTLFLMRRRKDFISISVRVSDWLPPAFSCFQFLSQSLRQHQLFKCSSLLSVGDSSSNDPFACSLFMERTRMKSLVPSLQSLAPEIFNCISSYSVCDAGLLIISLMKACNDETWYMFSQSSLVWILLLCWLYAGMTPFILQCSYMTMSCKGNTYDLEVTCRALIGIMHSLHESLRASFYALHCLSHCLSDDEHESVTVRDTERFDERSDGISSNRRKTRRSSHHEWLIYFWDQKKRMRSNETRANNKHFMLQEQSCPQDVNVVVTVLECLLITVWASSFLSLPFHSIF